MQGSSWLWWRDYNYMVNSMKKNIIKKITAFSLVEVLLSMAILSIFIVGTMKVITVKPAARKIEYPHGYFECYYDNGILRYRQYFGNALKSKGDDVSFCTFEPPTGSAFLNVNIVYPNCNQEEYDEATKKTTYNATGHSYVQSEVQSYANNLMKIVPPKKNSATTIYPAIFESNGKTYEYSTVEVNISEETLLKNMVLVTQKDVLPEMHKKLSNNTLGCISTGIGDYGGVFISW